MYITFCYEFLQSVAKPRKLERSVWDLVSSGGSDCEGERGLQHVQGGRTLRGRCRREQTSLVSPLSLFLALLTLLVFWKHHIAKRASCNTGNLLKQLPFVTKTQLFSAYIHRTPSGLCIFWAAHFWGSIWSWKWTNFGLKMASKQNYLPGLQWGEYKRNWWDCFSISCSALFISMPGLVGWSEPCTCDCAAVWVWTLPTPSASAELQESLLRLSWKRSVRFHTEERFFSF